MRCGSAAAFHAACSRRTTKPVSTGARTSCRPTWSGISRNSVRAYPPPRCAASGRCSPTVVDEGERTPEVDLAGMQTCRQAIEVLLAVSGPKEVAAVLLRDVFGLSYAEIVDVGGGREATWRQAVRRALMRARARTASCGDRDERASVEHPGNREADAVPERFQRAVLMADPAMLLDVLRACADGPPAPAEAVETADASRDGSGVRAWTRFELDGEGARLSLVLGGTVLCTLPATPRTNRFAALSGRSAPSPRCAAGTTASRADRTARA